MARGKFALAAVCTLALAPVLGGCAVAVVGGMAAAGGAGYEAGQERGLNGAYDDFNLKSQVSGALLNYYGTINVTTYQGRTLLTGTSPTPEQKAQAEQVASRVPGVTAVYNEIQVAAQPDPWQTAKDTWITTQVRSDMMLDPDIRSANYTIETEHQSVYLIGSARSQDELNRATHIARYVPGVQRVVSYVQIRSGVPNGSAPPPASYQPAPYQADTGPPPGGASMSPYGGPPTMSSPSMGPPGGSPSNAPIQVQKL